MALRYFGEAAVPAIPDLIASLGYPGVAGIGCAPETLAAIGPAALPAVEAALSSPREETRETAAYSLCLFIERGIRSPSLFPSLVRAIEDPAGGNRNAVSALGQLAKENPAALPVLERALQDERLASAAKAALDHLKSAK